MAVGARILPRLLREACFVPLLIAQLATTCFLTGLIWLVQIVHYPLLSVVGVDRASDVAVEHQTRTARVVGLPMAVEGVTALWLMFDRPENFFKVEFPVPRIFRFSTTTSAQK